MKAALLILANLVIMHVQIVVTLVLALLVMIQLIE